MNKSVLSSWIEIIFIVLPDKLEIPAYLVNSSKTVVVYKENTLPLKGKKSKTGPKAFKYNICNHLAILE